ncbi:MAG TPA: alanine:cation symporter family protein [Candidatus Paenalcaligenes intestinipullorum]|uniref:Alanine:cation symporter family protein n=1 Tax=Candidatus Paenalcaligenes intestinipullorum TaxID=2838718 RepID=A0A9D2U7Y2_9BURK|nr:alanine:cation symporter family protein [Candidatus Paenalcaligenes intestinipullorum]
MFDLLNDFLWSYVIVIVLVGLGLYFTIASRFVQFRYFGRMFGILKEAGVRKKGQLSSFQALMLSVAGRVGGGNIAGVAVAITLGGPGAIFWMWLIALVGMATSYFECTIAQVFKQRSAEGIYQGGPAFYIERGLGMKWLGLLVSFLLLITFGFGFNAVQSYTIASSLADTFAIGHGVTGVVLALVFALIIFGGILRIGKAADILVPVMAVSYILVSLYVFVLRFEEIPAALALIVRSAFGLEAALGGGIGAAITVGVKRGLFSNEAGLGSAPNVAAAADVPHPAAQGVVQAFSVFIDTIVICTCTSLVILLSGVYQPGMEAAGGVILTQTALSAVVGEWGRAFVSFALLLFVFTSIIYNYFLGQNALQYYTQSKAAVLIYRLLVVLMVWWGSVQDLSTVFGFADLTMGLLAVANLVALALLFKVVLRVMHDYDRQIRAGVTIPVFDASQFTDLNLDPSVWSTSTKPIVSPPRPVER